MHVKSILFVCAALLSVCASSARAADHVLTIGGGYAPSGNQISLERNVVFFRQVLADLYPTLPTHDVFFADGDSPNRDLQFEDPAWDVPEAYRLLARLDDDEGDLGYRYRSHELKDTRGPSSRAEIERWFADTGAKIKGGDRLILYVTGHGGATERDGKKEYDNNRIHLWNGDNLTVRELAALLDKLPTGVSVVAVMVQCYSGGFADLMFTGGRSDNGAAKASRCGFFATMPDRTAAGCTAEVNEATYQDYSSSFWAALRGKTRTGTAVDRAACDFDSDGKVTFAEAHAYVLLHDDSIDVPMTTSDRFLRLHSDAGASRGRLVSAEDMHPRLNALATPAERAVMDGLATDLNLMGGNNGAYRYAAAKTLSESLREQHRENERRKKELDKQFNGVCETIHDALELRWPEMRNRWDPAVDKILRDEPAEVVKAIKSHPRHRRFSRLYSQIGDLDEKDDALEAKWAKCSRLMRAIERVAMEHNLPLVADADTVARFKTLMGAESGTLGE